METEIFTSSDPMNDYTVVIPNRFEDIIKPLLASIKKFEDDPKVLIVADRHNNDYGYSKVDLEGKFSFAHSANTGILSAGEDDIILMNDDVRLLMPTFKRLQKIAYADPKTGILSPMVDGGCGNLFMRARQMKKVWPSDTSIHYCNGLGGDRITFACVYIKRKLLDEIGLFDEGFANYGYDDADMCIRTIKAKWKLAITNRLTVQHGTGGDKFIRGQNWNSSYVRTTGEDYRASLKYLRKKHPVYVR